MKEYMNSKYNFKILKRGTYLCMVLILVMLSSITAFAAESNKFSPKIAFATNSKDVMFFDTQYLTEPAITDNLVPTITIDGGIYVPIRAFSDALHYSVKYNAETQSIVLDYNNNPFEFFLIKSYEDLTKEMIYFSLNGTAYTKIENINRIENLNMIEKDGVFLIYKTLSSESNLDHSIWSAQFAVEENQLTLTDQLVEAMKKNLVPSTENYAETIQKNYVVFSVEKYNQIVNPYVPYTYTQMIADAEKLSTIFPKYIKTSVAGKSVEGRDITTIELGNGPKNIFICGSTHAREYISTTYIMNFIEKIALVAQTGENPTAYNIDQILKDVTFRIIPMVNPDGVNLVQNGIDSVSPEFREKVRAMPINEGSKYGYRTWKSNINGVDLNRNYPINWNLEKEKDRFNSPSSMNYYGPSPASEPEVQAVMGYLDKHNPDAVVAVHTQGQIIYWSNPENQLGDINKKIIAASGFQQGKTEDDGYLSNYARGKFNVYEITLELCKYVGPYPYPDDQFDKVWNPAKDICLIIADEISKR